MDVLTYFLTFQHKVSLQQLSDAMADVDMNDEIPIAMDFTSGRSKILETSTNKTFIYKVDDQPYRYALGVAAYLFAQAFNIDTPKMCVAELPYEID